MSSKVVFDIDRMGAAAHELYNVRTKMDALAQRASRLEAHGVKDPWVKGSLEAGARRMQLMALGDARELAACEHSVRGAMKRALAADAPSKRRPSRPKAKHRPRPGGRIRPSGHGHAVLHRPPAKPRPRPVPGTTKRARLGARIASNAKRMIGIERQGGAFTQMQRRVGSPDSAAWCAAYVYSAVLKSGKKLPDGGWAAVGNWVRAARARRNGLSIVSAGEAKAGDIVCYDWDGGSDFYGKSHIGVLESDVSNGRFTTVEGNTNNGVSTTRDRSMGVAENVVFIRVSP